MESDRPSSLSGSQRAAASRATWTTGTTPAPSDSVRATIDDMTSQMQAVVAAAERAADAIRLDAEEQAQRHIAEARRKADRLTADRVDLVSELTDDMIRHAAIVREHSEQLVQALEDAVGSFSDKLAVPAPSGRSTPSGEIPAAAIAPPGYAPAVPADDRPREETQPSLPIGAPVPAGSSRRPANGEPGTYTQIIGAPPPPPPATAPARVEHVHGEADRVGNVPQPTEEAAARAASNPNAASGSRPVTGPELAAKDDVTVDAVLFASQLAANGTDAAVIVEELRTRLGIEDPEPIVRRVLRDG